MIGNSLVQKVVLWRFISICVTMAVICVATGDVECATGITLFLHGILTVAHYLFEKLWEKVYASR